MAADTGANAAATSGTSITELNVNNISPYHFYMISSGQTSPCETLDSGTGSDLEQSTIVIGNSNGVSSSDNSSCNKIHTTSSPQITLSTSLASSSATAAPFSNTVSVSVGDVPKLEMHLQTTKIRINHSCSSSAASSSSSSSSTCSISVCSNLQNDDNARNYSPADDSEEGESCSSFGFESMHLNSTDDYVHSIADSPTNYNYAKPNRTLTINLPDSLLRDIRDHKYMTNDFVVNYKNAANQQEINENALNALNVAECTKQTAVKDVVVTSIVLPDTTSAYKYEADKYYNFHVNEHDNYRSFGNEHNTVEHANYVDFDADYLNDDAFAGYKDIRCGSNSSTIRSSKGTVRGVKNRVRNGIATFLQQQQQQAHIKNYKEKDSGKVVLYTTSLGIIRDTYAKCANVKHILRTLLVKYEERDVFMSIEYQQQIRERMQSQLIRVPQLFVEGQHIGGAEIVERLNESGELRQLLKSYKSIATVYTCQTCGGYRLLPCPSCSGSKKSVHRNHFTAEFVALKCMNCDEVGLVKCHNCLE